MHIVSSQQKSLKLTELVLKNDTQARFNGKMKIAGTLVAKWYVNESGDYSSSPEYVIVPDKMTVAALPYFYLDEPPYFRRYKVTTIDIENGEQAIRLVAGDQVSTRFLNKRTPTVKITGSFLISHYSVGVECDAPWAKARVESFSRPSQFAKHQNLPDRC
jgi:hypothetical protein